MSTNPDLSVSPTFYNFGSVKVGQESAIKAFTMKNIGTADLEITPIALTGTGLENFDIQSDNCSNQTIGPSLTCMVTVSFSPQSEGLKSGNISIRTNESDPLTLVPLSGTGFINRTPTANDQSVATQEDTPLAVSLTGSDPDGDPLTFTALDGPSQGSLNGTPPNVTYTPNANYNGSDSFTYKANDGTVDSNTATVSVTVNPVNDPPTAADQSVIMNENEAKAIILSGSDVDGDSLAYAKDSDPSNGVLSAFDTAAGTVTYTPNTDFSGKDSFTYTVNDGTVDSVPATVSITVIPANGLLGEYYNNSDLTELVLTRIDPEIDFMDWGTGSPDPAIGPDSFSVRWMGQIEADFDETYTFNVVKDDGARLWIAANRPTAFT